MRLLAISDLHLDHRANWEGLLALPPHPDDWLMVAGDVCHTEKQFAATMKLLSERFDRVFWTPGNHDLWTWPANSDGPRGVFKYNRLVSICREFNVLTPEDSFIRWPLSDYIIAPTFTLYDYSFRPDSVSAERAIAWAAEKEIVCADEYVLHPDPFASRTDWCIARCRYTERRLQEVVDQGRIIVLNHYPLRQAHAILPRIPRFSIWCGTRRTEPWFRQFAIETVVYGHLHIRTSRRQDGVRFEEVSLGYPQQWYQQQGMHTYFRQIL